MSAYYSRIVHSLFFHFITVILKKFLKLNKKKYIFICKYIDSYVF